VQGDFRIGEWLVQPQLNQISGRGKAVRVEPKAMQVLVCLAEHSDQVVSKEKLMHAVWADTFVTDDVLTRCISELRKAFDDDAREPRVIETIPRRGYRFLAPVENPAPAAAPAASVLVRRLGWAARAALALLLLLAAFVALNVGGLRERLFAPATLAPRIQSIAVLPLKNLTGDPAQDYFVDGMHDALTAELAKISALRVTSRASTLRYAKTDKPLPEIARELANVEGIITGGVMIEGQQVRISVQLIHAASDRHLWARSFDRQKRDILSLYSDVAQAIAGEVRVQVTPQEQVRLARTRPVDPQVYEAYLKGQRYSWLGPFDDDWGAAIRSFSQALDLDPTYAPAQAGLALVYQQTAWTAKSATATRAELDRARNHALKALELDDSLGEAHAVLGGIRLAFDWDWAASESSVRRAVELDPNSFTVHVIHVIHSMAMAKFDEALRRCRNYCEVDPLAPVNFNWYGMAYYNLGDYDRALEQWETSLKLNPKFWAPRMWQAFAYVQKGMLQEAVVAARDCEKWAGADREALAHAGHIYGRVGMKEEAVRILKKLEERSRIIRLSLGQRLWSIRGWGITIRLSHGWTRLSNRGVLSSTICDSFPRMDLCAMIRASRICCGA
jgi:DNA-binding winged helix-turn-helix (wHTH) protein/TolB-like protein/tetratricopeptide (TPR) repeat protein